MSVSYSTIIIRVVAAAQLLAQCPQDLWVQRCLAIIVTVVAVIWG